MEELDRSCGDFYPLLQFMRLLDEGDINEFDGYGELVYIKKSGYVFIDKGSDAINDICDYLSQAYEDKPDTYLIGVVWYNK